MNILRRIVFLFIVLPCAAAALLALRVPCEAAQKPNAALGEWKATEAVTAKGMKPAIELREKKGRKALPAIILFSDAARPVVPLFCLTLLGETTPLPLKGNTISLRVDDNEPHRFNAEVFRSKKSEPPLLQVVPGDVFFKELFAGKTLHIRVELPNGAVLQETFPLNGVGEAWERAKTLLPKQAPQKSAQRARHGAWTSSVKENTTFAAPAGIFQESAELKILPTIHPYYDDKKAVKRLLCAVLPEEEKKLVQKCDTISLRIDDGKPHNRYAKPFALNPSDPLAPFGLVAALNDAFFEELLAGKTLHIQVTLPNGAVLQETFPLDGVGEAWERVETSFPALAAAEEATAPAAEDGAAPAVDYAENHPFKNTNFLAFLAAIAVVTCIVCGAAYYFLRDDGQGKKQ